MPDEASKCRSPPCTLEKSNGSGNCPRLHASWLDSANRVSEKSIEPSHSDSNTRAAFHIHLEPTCAWGGSGPCRSRQHNGVWCPPATSRPVVSRPSCHPPRRHQFTTPPDRTPHTATTTETNGQRERAQEAGDYKTHVLACRVDRGTLPGCSVHHGRTRLRVAQVRA